MTTRLRYQDEAERDRDRWEARRDREAPPRWAKVVCTWCRTEVEPDDLERPTCPVCNYGWEE